MLWSGEGDARKISKKKEDRQVIGERSRNIWSRNVFLLSGFILAISLFPHFRPLSSVLATTFPITFKQLTVIRPANPERRMPNTVFVLGSNT